MSDMNPPNSPVLSGNRESSLSDRSPNVLIEIRQVQKLRGPSVWALCPLLEVTLKIDAEGRGRQMAELGRCEAWQPILAAHSSASADAANAGAGLAQACAALVLQL